MNSKRLILVVVLLLFSFASLRAQDEIGELVKGSIEDANYLLKGYTAPTLRAFGSGLNQGWYNTAKPHKLGGADITITVSPIYIPTSDNYYQVDNSKLKSLTLISPTDGKVPTLLGPDSPTPKYQNKATGSVFDGPTGLGQINLGGLKLKLGAVPVPMAQIGIGLPKGFDVKFRYLPSFDIGDNGSLKMIGFGLMHDVKQYIPGIKNLPFDLSGFVGYTKMNMDVGLDSSKPDQHALFEAVATTVQGVVSKKISVLTVYGGFGYNIAKTNLAMKGTYSFENPAPVPPTQVKDPVNFDVSSSGPRFSAGMRLKLAVFAFNADYTFQKYKALSVGFGINFR